MPAIKHPCPHCGKWIMRDVAACPYCGTADPFAPRRCPSCRAIVEDAAWIACPSCGASLSEEPSADPAPAASSPVGPAAAPSTKAGASADADPAATCTGCGSPLPPGARFCAVCGTLVS
jgi:predicted RNA-binding Zn-ribbon protein involved in translation (DUF1610 family)